MKFLIFWLISFNAFGASFVTEGKGIRLTCKSVNEGTLFWGDIYVCEYKVIRKNTRTCAIYTKHPQSGISNTTVDCSFYEEVVKNTF